MSETIHAFGENGELSRGAQIALEAFWLANGGGGGGGATVHEDLTGRSDPNQHPIGAITGLTATLANKSDVDHEHTAAQISDATTTGRVLMQASSAIAARTSIGAAASTHTHDNRYYTEDEVDTALAGKANTSHQHPVTDLEATGTPSETTYLRGDGAWATPAGGGGGAIIPSPGPARWLTPYNVLEQGTRAKPNPALYVVTHETSFTGVEIRVHGSDDPPAGSAIRIDVYALDEGMTSGTHVASTPEMPLVTKNSDVLGLVDFTLQPGLYVVSVAVNAAAETAILRTCSQALPTRYGSATFNEMSISRVNGFYVYGHAQFGSSPSPTITLSGGGYYASDGPRAVLAGFRRY